jgi:hypothetical protein
MLLNRGFKEVMIGGRLNYEYKGHYCIPNYLHTLGFFVERAHSHNDAMKNFHEDGDCHALSLGKAQILRELEAELTEDVLTRDSW